MGLRQILPWHTKRILVIRHTLRSLFFFIIAGFFRRVEGGGGLQSALQMLKKLRLGPAGLKGGVQVPGPLPGCFALLQKDYVQGPAQPEGLLQEFRLVPIGQGEGPHPPEVPGREALPLRISGLEILRRHHRRALLRPGADCLSDGKVESCLRQDLSHEPVQIPIELGKICGLSYIQMVSSSPYVSWTGEPK